MQTKKIIFLHHSTGLSIWIGKTNKYIYKIIRKGDVQKYFNNYNRTAGNKLEISERIFPKSEPYGWKNYPFDYYNIWVKNAGNKAYMGEPTLEMLTPEFNTIIFKHCFPVSRLSADEGKPDIDSEIKRFENYKLQYNALKEKMHEFPDNNFIVWTPAACTKNQISEDEAKRTHDFYRWILDEWDEKGDNIFVWDFYKFETEGGIYLLDKYAQDANNSHPGKSFSAYLSPIFCKFVIDVTKSNLN